MNEFKTLLLVFLHCSFETQTLSKDANIPKHHYFSTKNLYAISRDLMNIPDLANHISLSSELQMHSCEAVQINGLIRHGSRNPGKKDLRNLDDFFTRLDTYEQANGESQSHVKDTFDKFRRLWRENHLFPNATVTDKELVQTGYEELFQMASDIERHFQSLFVDHSRLKFVSSNTHRSIHSCLAFQDGLKLLNKYRNYTMDDGLLRYYDACELYQHRVADNDSLTSHHDLFKTGLEIKSISSRLQEKLSPSNATETLDIRFKDIKSMYTVAACEYAAYGSSILLSLFDRRDLAILEYAADLRSYWRRSYGFEINYSQACHLLEHMIQSMKQYIEDPERSPKGVFRFGHAETLFPVLTLLGLYNDSSPLTADGFHSRRDRLFRTGKIMPFAGNIMFVLYQCDLNEDTVDGAYKVMLLHNEKPVSLPACPDTVLCPFVTFVDYYRKWTDGCDFEEICRVNESHDEL